MRKLRLFPTPWSDWSKWSMDLVKSVLSWSLIGTLGWLLVTGSGRRARREGVQGSKADRISDQKH